ncbi:MAG: hypothetical protein PHD22_07485 [Zoogloea sp.]|nr:hypothetical protein [Zoogloea sp.]
MTLIGKGVYRLGNPLQFGPAFLPETPAGVGRHHQSELVRQPGRGQQGTLDKTFHQNGRGPSPHQTNHDEQAHAGIENRLQNRPLLGSEIPPEGDASEHQHAKHQTAGKNDGQHLPVLQAHVVISSRDFTLATSSLVEKGLVM